MNNIREYINIVSELDEKDDVLKSDRKKILDYIGHNDWSIVLRKLNNRFFSNYASKFGTALSDIKLSVEFIDKYRHLKVFPSFMTNIIKNKHYTESELVEIIDRFSEDINWYYIFYNDKIPLWYKKQNYDKIYQDMMKSYDIRVPEETREKNTKKALSILKDEDQIV